MNQDTVLIIEDTGELADILRDYLEAEGFRPLIAADGLSGLDLFQTRKPDLVILDLMLPDIDGLEICRRLRALSNIPILILSAKSSDVDKIIGLGLGADDYIGKPFSPGEVVARVKAQLRRYHRMSPEPETQLLCFGSLIIDEKSHVVSVAGKNVDLPAKAFALLSFLANNPRQVFSREQLYRQIWGIDDYADINTITVHIRKIREKIESDPNNPLYILTVWGVGYKFNPDGQIS